MYGPPENILGMVMGLQFGMDHFDLIFTERRIVAARTHAASNGRIGGEISQWLRDPGGPDRYLEMTLEQILAADRLNFEMPYGHVESALLNGGVRWFTVPSLTIWCAGKRRRFAFMDVTRQIPVGQLEKAKQLLQVTVGPKVTFKKA